MKQLLTTDAGRIKWPLQSFQTCEMFEEEVQQPAAESAALADVAFSQVFKENHLECGCDAKH